MRGVALGGEIPIGDGIEVSLGNEVPVRVAPAPVFAGAVSIEAGRCSYLAPLGPARIGVGDWELVSCADDWVELVITSPPAYLGQVTLASPIPLLPTDEVASERGGNVILKLA